MEPILMVSAFILFVGGDILINDQSAPDIRDSEQSSHIELVRKNAAVGYERGYFAWSDDGYYISNLTPEPIQPEGCDKPVLVSDLSVPKSGQTLPVESVDLGCGG